MSGKLSKTAITLLDFTLLLKPLGEIIFDSNMRHESGVQVSSLVMVGLAILYILSPTSFILKNLFDEKFKEEQKTYQEARVNFNKTYQTEHPIMALLNRKEIETMYLKSGYSFEETNSRKTG